VWYDEKKKEIYKMVESKFDLTNQRFGKLTVIKRVDDIYDNGMPRVAYLCRCDCGKERVYRQASLRHGGAKTCGSSECRKGRATIYNTYDLSGDYGIGYTRKGEEFYFDKEDYGLIKDYHWELHRGYITCHRWNPQTQSHNHVKMHRLIMGLKDNTDYSECQIDHINHNKVDNRKENLRVVNNIQNSWNKSVWREDGSKVGVRLERGKWLASITVNGKMIKLGTYDNYNDAVKARIDAEKKYWG
jgi:hypothetical protein